MSHPPDQKAASGRATCCVAVMCGLPGAGKSTLAHNLASRMEGHCDGAGMQARCAGNRAIVHGSRVHGALHAGTAMHNPPPPPTCAVEAEVLSLDALLEAASRGGTASSSAPPQSDSAGEAYFDPAAWKVCGWVGGEHLQEMPSASMRMRPAWAAVISPAPFITPHLLPYPHTPVLAHPGKPRSPPGCGAAAAISRAD